MKLCRLSKLLALAGTVAILAASCSSFPKEQLTLDLSNSDTPVMLNAIDKTAVKGKTLTYQAGYQSLTTSATARNGGATATVTSTMSSNQNSPLGMQMQGLLINDPQWVGVESLNFNVNLFDSFFMSSKSYMLSADAFVPAAKK
jgi:hypothetical protein